MDGSRVPGHDDALVQLSENDHSDLRDGRQSRQVNHVEFDVATGVEHSGSGRSDTAVLPRVVVEYYPGRVGSSCETGVPVARRKSFFGAIMAVLICATLSGCGPDTSIVGTYRPPFVPI